MDIIHALDQINAFLRDIAPILAKYKKDLMKEGFSEEEAIQLVRDFQNNLLNQAKG